MDVGAVVVVVVVVMVVKGGSHGVAMPDGGRAILGLATQLGKCCNC